MRVPDVDMIAHSIKDTHLSIAVDLLRMRGYTRKAALNALGREGRSLARRNTTA